MLNQYNLHKILTVQ